LRLGVAAAVALATMAGLPSAAFADGTSSAWKSDDGDIGAGAGNSGGGGGSARSGGGSAAKVTCTYSRLSDERQLEADELARKGWSSEKTSEVGAWYQKVCVDEAGRSTGTVVWIPDRTATARQLAEEAFDRTTVPLPEVRLNPPDGSDQVVNLPTWLWVDPAQWQSVTASASAGPISVTVTARPQRIEWDLGNGDRVACPGPGTPYDASRPAADQASSCSYTYRRSSAAAPEGTYRIKASVVWRVTWVASGVAASGDLGSVSRTTTIPVRVAEVQAVNQ
jgi:hypothetical protein